jgi:PAS domain S-box-containing protein
MAASSRSTAATLAQYEGIVASLGGIVWECDARTFDFSFVSDQAERLLGYPRAQWLEPGFWSAHIHPDDRDWVVAFCTNATREGRDHDFEYRMVAADGRTVWLRDIVSVVLDDGHPDRLRGVMVDVTERRQRDDALRESGGRLALAARASHVGLWDWDLLTNHVVFSPEWKSQLGYNDDEIRGDYLEWETRVHPDDLAPTLHALMAYQSGAAPEYDVEFRMRHKDGAWRWIYARGEVLRDPSGKPTRMLGCHVDVTERKRAEEERQAHLWFFESLDRVNRAMHGSSDLDQMFTEVLDAVLAVFECDRATLVYPCDPSTASWMVVTERTRPEYPGVGSHVTMPATPAMADIFTLVRASAGPVSFGRAGDNPLPAGATERFGIRSQIISALYPKAGHPYAFTLQQCSRERQWSDAERRLFQEIGRRLADGLSSLVIQRQLQESEHRLKAAQRIAHVGYWQNDIEHGVLTWSEETFRIWGFDPPAPPDVAALRDRIHPDDRDWVATAVWATVQGGPRHDMEFRIVRPSGEERILHSQGDLETDASGQARRIFGTVQDITELRHAERAIVESHNLMTAIVEGTTDIVFAKDLHGRYLLVNSTGAARFGLTPAQIVGRDDREVFRGQFPPAVAEEVMRLDQEILQTGEARTFEEVFVLPDGPRTFLTAKGGFRDARGQVRGLIGITRDITDLKTLEDQLRQAQKMEAVGQLAGGIAHDFNNLLTVITGYSQLIFGRLDAADPHREMLAEIQKSGVRAADLTRQLLAFSRKQVLQPRVVNIATLLVEVLKLLQRLIGENIDVAFVQGAGLDLVEIDPGQFEQAIINLAVNARDAMPDGGRLTIETRNYVLDEAESRRHGEIRRGQYVGVAISDTGVGMDAATAGRIFEPFFTTKEPGKGTGLGLAMVYGFVTQSGGHIDVHSEPGRGTTFTLLLPHADHPAPAEPAARDGERIPHGSETLLLVEDEAAVRDLSKRVLQSCGYVVLDAPDGPAALRLAAEQSGVIHALISDLVMPRMSGTQLAEALARIHPETRVLLMSGYTDRSMPVVSATGIEFLQKPFSPMSLARKVREVLDAGRP